MAEIFALKPEDEKKLHSYALKRLRDWTEDLVREVPQLGQLDIDEINADINAYLNDDEKARVMKYKTDVAEWLRKCTDIGDGYSPYPYSTLAFHPMSELRQLVKTAYKRKEEKERWRAARKAINPPIDDAEKYLNKLGEHDKYIQAALVAIEVYMEKGEEYVDDSRTFDYRWYLTEISRRKAREAQKAHAISEAKKYNAYLNQEISRLRSKLEPKQKDLLSYFKLKIKDSRHTDHNFDYVLSAEETKDFDSTLVSLAKQKLEQLIPNDSRQFIAIPSQYYRIYIPLPSASYNFKGIPCLDFSFDIFAAAYGEVWLKASQKEFEDYIFDLPVTEGPSGSALLEKPQFIGYHYLVLTPQDLGGCVPWESIPLVLIKGLMNGELQPAGTTVLAASEARTTYKIKGFEGEATIPDSFANYLKEIGGIDQMVSIGIIGKKVANVIEKTFTQPETKGKTPLLPDKQGTGYEDKDLLSSLTELGIPFKEAESLLPLIPKNLALPEAIKFALQKHMKS